MKQQRWLQRATLQVTTELFVEAPILDLAFSVAVANNVAPFAPVDRSGRRTLAAACAQLLVARANPIAFRVAVLAQPQQAVATTADLHRWNVVHWAEVTNLRCRVATL